MDNYFLLIIDGTKFNLSTFLQVAYFWQVFDFVTGLLILHRWKIVLYDCHKQSTERQVSGKTGGLL